MAILFTKVYISYTFHFYRTHVESLCYLDTLTFTQSVHFVKNVICNSKAVLVELAKVREAPEKKTPFILPMPKLGATPLPIVILILFSKGKKNCPNWFWHSFKSEKSCPNWFAGVGGLALFWLFWANKADLWKSDIAHLGDVNTTRPGIFLTF